jgi:endonuclease YncB( thermonuclease family)
MRGGLRLKSSLQETITWRVRLPGKSPASLHGHHQQKVRLNGIDRPERGQPWSKKAKQFTSFMVFGRDVTVREFGRDKYGRLIADIITPEGQKLNHELAREGLAWWYRKHSQDQSLGRLEKLAQWGKTRPLGRRKSNSTLGMAPSVNRYAALSVLTSNSLGVPPQRSRASKCRNISPSCPLS